MKRVRISRAGTARASAVLGAAAIVAALAGCGSSSDESATTPSDVDTSAVPAQVTWDQYRGVAVPVSAVDGPSVRTGVAPAGYAQTPQGAVIAAMQGQTRLALAPDDAWAATTQQVAAAGPGRDAFSVARVMTSITTEADPAQTAQFAGFRVEDYSNDATTVWLATRMPDGSLSASPTHAVWAGGDWKVELPDPAVQGEGDQPAPTDPTSLPSLDGYVAFAAAN